MSYRLVFLFFCIPCLKVPGVTYSKCISDINRKSDRVRVIGGQIDDEAYLYIYIYNIVSWEGGMDKNASEFVHRFWCVGGE